jgi:hypothetical protein
LATVSLLLAVELLTHRASRRDQDAPSETTADTATETAETRRKRRVSTAEEVMWAHFQSVRAQGRVPTGAELDRVAGTHNYGRAVVRRWRRAGRLTPESVSAGSEMVIASG